MLTDKRETQMLINWPPPPKPPHPPSALAALAPADARKEAMRYLAWLDHQIRTTNDRRVRRTHRHTADWIRRRYLKRVSFCGSADASEIHATSRTIHQHTTCAGSSVG